MHIQDTGSVSYNSPPISSRTLSYINMHTWMTILFEARCSRLEKAEF